MFNISPNEVRVVFIVNSNTEDKFLSYLFNLGYSWLEREFDDVSKRLETIGTLLIRDNDSRIEKVFRKFYEVSGITYYFVGTKHLCAPVTVDPFIHNIYVSSDQWKDFNRMYENMYGISFNEHLKQIK